MHSVQLQQVALDNNNNAAAYLENYLDCVENLPDDLQRHISHMRELDVEYQGMLFKLEGDEESFAPDLDVSSRKRCLTNIQQRLIKTQELGDEKLHLVQQILDLIENKARQLETDVKNMGPKIGAGKDQENSEPGRTEAQQPERSSKRARRQRNDAVVASMASTPDVAPERAEERPTAATSSTAAAAVKKTKKKKRRNNKAEKDRDYSPVEPPVDPNEPTYCLCEQISYGEMIGCDNDRCHIEWFHFSCVGLTTKPKGKWFCPKCRGDRQNVQKPRT